MTQPTYTFSILRVTLLTIVALLLTPLITHAHATSRNGLTVTDTRVEAPFDTVPRFCNPPNIPANELITTTKSGTWSDPSVWSTNQIPGTDAKVQISPDTTITYDTNSTTKLDCIEVQGHLTFSTTTSTKLYLNELMVMPEGSLTIGTEQQPVPANVTVDIIFNDSPLKTGTLDNPGIDPSMYGKGLLVFGDVTIHGHKKDPTFSRVIGDLTAGQTQIQLTDAPTGWQVGDKLILPDTRQLHPDDFDGNRPVEMHWEELTLQSVSGNTVTLQQPLNHDHPCARDADAELWQDRTITVLPNGEQLCGHIGNLTRNVTFQSENPDSVRAHSIYFHRAVVNVRYSAYVGMGRTSVEPLDNTTYDENGNPDHFGTNQIGRYSYHVHHVWGIEGGDPRGYQAELIGNAVDDSPKWCISIHDTHYSLIKDNVHYNCDGAGFVTEDGSESFNLIEHNFAVRSEGSGNGTTSRNNGKVDNGHEGNGFWLQGVNNTFKDNVAANGLRTGFNFFTENNANVYLPTVQGEDPSINGKKVGPYIRFEPYLGDIINAEAYGSYGSFGQGIEFWRTQRMPVRDSIAWHNYMSGLSGANGSQQTWDIDGLIVRTHYDPQFEQELRTRILHSPQFNRYALGLGWVGPYTLGATMRNLDIQGASIAIPENPLWGKMNIQDSYFRNHRNFTWRPKWRSDTPKSQQRQRNRGETPLYFKLRNNVFEGIPDVPFHSITWKHITYRGLSSDFRNDLTKMSAEGVEVIRVIIYNDNQIPGMTDHVMIYSPQQAPDYVIPNKNNKFSGCPAGDGMTNRECWDAVGVAMSGSVAPCIEIDNDPLCAAAKERAQAMGADALVFPFTGDEPPPPQTAPPRITISQPVKGASLQTDTINVRYSASGDLNAANVDHIHLKLDNNPEVRDTDFDGKFTFENVPAGDHTLTGYLAQADHAKVEGTDISVTFTTNAPPTPNNPPTITFDTAVDDLIATVGQLFTLSVTATDEDGDDLTLTADPLPEGAVFE